MQSEKIRIPQILTLSAFVLVLGYALFSYFQEHKHLSVFDPGDENMNSYGGNIWVKWRDTEKGVVADYVNPVIENIPLSQGRYFKKGDILRKIDFLDVYKKDVVENIINTAKPGTIMLFQVERPAKSSFEHHWEDIFVEISFEPRFSFPRNPTFWILYPWIIVPGLFFSLVSLLIIFPIVRPSFLQNWPVMGVIFLSLLLFTLLSTRHLNLLVRTEFVKFRLEQIFTIGIICTLILYGLASLVHQLSAKARWLVIVPAGLFVYPFISSFSDINGGNLSIFGPAIERVTWSFFLATSFFTILFSLTAYLKKRSVPDIIFHFSALLFSGSLTILFLSTPSSGIKDSWRFLAMASTYIPLVNAAASQLKFGKVSVVLTGTLQYIVFFALSLFGYFIVHEILPFFGVIFKYQAYLEISLVVFLMLLMRVLYQSYERRFRKYFVLAQQKKRDQINHFISMIPQYSSSEKLVRDTENSLREYFDVEEISFAISGIPAEKEPGIDESEIMELMEYMEIHHVYWSRSRQLSMEALPERLERILKTTGFALALPINVNENIRGLLLLGNKRRGVYNLDDIEITGRVIQQTRLTLGVLHLLEREKVLMQKNYEANLTALRSQINPHFLFNTLNTISALIHDDPDGAEDATEKLAFIFRYTLKHSDKTFVHLEDELQLVKTYLEIEKIRFGKRLELMFDIDKALNDVLIPAFVVQTVVENCIKHGISKILDKGLVSIRVFREGDMMVAEIEDNGPGIDLSKVTTSTGLNNITTRLEQIYEMKNLLYFENTGNGTRVLIKIPLNYEHIQGSDR